MNLRSRAYLHRFAYLNGGLDREEFATSACVLNSTLIGMYKRNVLGSMRTHTLIHLNLFVHTTVSGFWCTPSKSLYMRPLGLRSSQPMFAFAWSNQPHIIFKSAAHFFQVHESTNIYGIRDETALKSCWWGRLQSLE